MPESLYERMEELSRLRQAGLIDEAEHRRAKAAILNVVPDAMEVDAAGRTRGERLALFATSAAGVLIVACAALVLIFFAGRSLVTNAAIVALAFMVIALYRGLERKG